MADVAVVGMPDPVMGERVCAFIVPREGEVCTLEDFVEFFKAKQIAMFKIPERLECVQEIPRIQETRKADKKLMRRMIAEKLST